MCVLGWSRLVLQKTASRSRPTSNGSSLTPMLRSSRICCTQSTMSTHMLKRADRTWPVASKAVIGNGPTVSLTSDHRYHLPNSVREHVDYITPGISLREVTSVRRSTDKQKRFVGRIPPILEPISLPLEKLLSETLSFCSQAITPQCIQRK